MTFENNFQNGSLSGNEEQPRKKESIAIGGGVPDAPAVKRRISIRVQRIRSLYERDVEDAVPYKGSGKD